MSLVAHDVGPCEALVLQAATGRSPAEGLQANRGWSDDEWGSATESLKVRGWLDAAGSVTAEGAAVRDAIEEDTDRLAATAVRGLSAERATELVEALQPLAARVMDTGTVPASNNMGVPWPPRAGSSG